VCPTQHWLWSCLLHASQDPNRRTGTQWGCFRNNRGCLAYDAIAFRACTMRHVYLSPRVKKCWKRRENRGFCLRESKIGGRQFLHTCKSGVARESFSGTPQHEHAGAAQPVSVTLHSGTPPPGPGDRHRGILGGDSGAGRIRIRKRGTSGLTIRGSTADSTPDAEVRQDVTRKTRKRRRTTAAALHLKRKPYEE